MNFLLSDEKVISIQTFEKRKRLYDEFMTLPVDFLSKMRHFQPQIGCFNNCSFCSKFSTCKVECWDEEQLRNIVSAIKFASKSYTNGDILLAWDRKEHREGVIFPYLDNDIGSYPYLYEFIDLCYKELGVKTRISTVGYSRHNRKLNEMHKKIAKSNLICALGGVRLSITQFGKVWEEKNGKSSLNDYIEDTANFLKIYKPYYDMFGSGRRKMCVELRFNPFVETYPVYDFEYNGKKIISSGNYLFISVDKNIKLNLSHITDPYIHALKISESPVIFKEYNLIKIPNDMQELKNMIDEQKMDFVRDSDGYLFENKDGIYYSFNPSLTEIGNYGTNIYPLKGERKKSGYIVTERFFLNALYEFKHRRGLNLKDNYYLATWNDVTVDGTTGRVTGIAISNGKAPSTGVIPGVEVSKTEKNNYSDGTDTATIPEGFTVDEKENTISKGLVVHGPDGSEFVWVPVPDINSMSQCSKAGGSCKNSKL